MDRIKINGVWYVKEDTIKKSIIELDPTRFEGYIVENDDFCFEATRIFKDDGTPYKDCVDIECTDKRFENRKDWTVEHWDNTSWMRGIVDSSIESWKELPDMGKSTNTALLQTFLRFLTDKGWL
jgi:hypothetical protein